ncbi:XRE family transcriptional regulator [Mangrovimicrobium sediminis]|uniref:XRE family transcriptional regulator n=1 Tax=Mangrovimicrobium sediminis TaxID=2562682 RepID=A0A4Z0LVY0_9GAMM|nr:helix-turn-helix domain-containing protein [Haliea sp. SAOS-164]TGD71410.1 XRE family transcriptional regulator [Haliea sp. SAOS-164]
MAKDEHSSDSLLDALRRLTGQVAGGTLELARSTATLTAMFGETWLRNTVLNQLEPERQEAMREAGDFLRDARETAGLSVKEMSETLGLSDGSVLEDVERGNTIMPLEMVLRSASLLARHDPIPFLIKFMRTYNPALEQTLEQLGVMALPRQYERERRFVNLYRQHDVLRSFTDEEYERFIHYMVSSSNLVVDMMQREKEARTVPADADAAESKTAGGKRSTARPAAKARAKAKAKTTTTRTRSSSGTKRSTPKSRKKA